jgi:hypothetical protein
MATFDYSGVIATAKSLIDKFGKTMIRVTSVESGDEWNPTTVEFETNVVGVMTSYKNNQIDGTLIKATDKQILTYNAVDIGDKIKDETISYNVINVDIIAPANDKILYKVQVRK